MNPLSAALAQTPAYAHWQPIGIFPHHGINIALSALHSQQSCGIGEFFDLLPLIDWCRLVGMDVIQLLPLNDSGNDPTPYNALSSCALNPIFLSLRALPYLEELPDLKNELASFTPLNRSTRILYGEVLSRKMRYLRTYFRQVGELLLASENFAIFAKENSWLTPYALFKVLKEFQGLTPWMSWPQEIQKLTPSTYTSLCAQHAHDISFHLLLQYLCYEQLSSAKRYAGLRGVFLKGDIPILISSDSADVWFHPQFFDLTLAAGAPPDTYNPEGQYWGLPLFHWGALKADGYSWWKERLRYATLFYDIYRIDHVLGFFRIWAIERGHSSREGQFIPADPKTWEAHGEELLRMLLDASPMLPIAEDLGALFPGASHCLKKLGICGTRIIRWERDWTGDGHFIAPENYPPLTMTSVSTHDSETLQLWWESNTEDVRLFCASKHWQYAPTISREQRRAILWESHHTASLFHINLLQEYLALFNELTWPNPSDERINIPGYNLPTNWVYRLRPSLEELLTHAPLAQAVWEIIYSPTPDLYRS